MTDAPDLIGPALRAHLANEIESCAEIERDGGYKAEEHPDLIAARAALAQHERDREERRAVVRAVGGQDALIPAPGKLAEYVESVLPLREADAAIRELEGLREAATAMGTGQATWRDVRKWIDARIAALRGEEGP